MKLVVLLLPSLSYIPRFNRFWLLLAPTSHLRLRPILSPAHQVVGVCYNVLILGAGVVFFCILVHHYKLNVMLQGYLAAPLLFLMSDLLHRCFTILWLPSGKLLPDLHCRPWLAQSIVGFWGQRWNLWFSDWFRYAIFQRLRRMPIRAMFIVFFVSGMIHEWVINVPLYAVFEVNRFGSMMIYFLMQPVGIFLQRQFECSARGSFMLTWLFVLGPAPLVINEGLLRMMHLYTAGD